jgi:RNA polymerase sigma-70 factor (ECF subfamily)
MNTFEETTDLIIERAIQGDDEAFSLLYQENLKKIYNYIYYRTGNNHDAEDLTEVPLEEQTELRNKQEIPEREIEDRQEIEFLLSAIHKLTHDRQMVLILKYVEDLSNKEIGDIMRKSEGAIKSLYHRTLLELREYLEFPGEDE